MFTLIVFICGMLLGVAVLLGLLAGLARLFGGSGVGWLLFLAMLFGAFAVAVFAVPTG